MPTPCLLCIATRRGRRHDEPARAMGIITTTGSFEPATRASTVAPGTVAPVKVSSSDAWIAGSGGATARTDGRSRSTSRVVDPDSHSVHGAMPGRASGSSTSDPPRSRTNQSRRSRSAADSRSSPPTTTTLSATRSAVGSERRAFTGGERRMPRELQSRPRTSNRASPRAPAGRTLSTPKTAAVLVHLHAARRQRNHRTMPSAPAVIPGLLRPGRHADALSPRRFAERASASMPPRQLRADRRRSTQATRDPSTSRPANRLAVTSSSDLTGEKGPALPRRRRCWNLQCRDRHYSPVRLSTANYGSRTPEVGAAALLTVAHAQQKSSGTGSFRITPRPMTIAAAVSEVICGLRSRTIPP